MAAGLADEVRGLRMSLARAAGTRAALASAGASPTARAATGEAHARTAGVPSSGTGADLVAVATAATDGLLELLAELERLKSTASALQARLAVEVDARRRSEEAHDGVPAARRGRGVALELALARGESHHRSRVLLGAAKALVGEMPHTFAAFGAGELSEHAAVLLVRETACLSVEARAGVDAAVCRTSPRARGVGVRAMVAEARRHGARIEPGSLVRRARRAESERCVTVRPAPDAMVYLTALLPVAAGVQAFAALRAAADSARASGGGTRGRGQMMADLLVERLTGRDCAAAVPVTVNLVMSDASLLASGTEPATVDGFGPVPAQVARTMVAAGLDAGATWLRRLYADPAGDLVAASSRRRFHPEGLAALLRARDHGTCRMPYCDAPARHLDHVRPAAAGGSTSADNAQGLCEACNLAKEPAGVRARVEPGALRHTVVTTTRFGTVHRSVAPPVPAPVADGVEEVPGIPPGRPRSREARSVHTARPVRGGVAGARGLRPSRAESLQSAHRSERRPRAREPLRRSTRVAGPAWSSPAVSPVEERSAVQEAFEAVLLRALGAVARTHRAGPTGARSGAAGT